MLATQLSEVRLPDHQYSIAAIRQAVQIYTVGVISFRACCRVIALLKPELSAFNIVPTNNTIQSWVLRIGLYQLSRPVERADDWVIILDHTCQLGPHKCLIVLGIRRSHWATLSRPLVLQDLSVLMIRVVTSSTGLLVQQQLIEVQARIGTIAAIVSDQGADLVCGSKLFANQQPDVSPNDVSPNDVSQPHVSSDDSPQLFDSTDLTVAGRAKPLVLKDFSHASSHLLKAHLEADKQWHEFLSLCGKTQPKVKQTIWGCFGTAHSEGQRPVYEYW